MRLSIHLVFIFILSAIHVVTQPYTNLGRIQTRKLFLFDTQRPFTPSSFGISYPFQFEVPFINLPIIGIAVYAIDFEHSPQFSSATSNTTLQGSNVVISSSSSSTNSLIYVMYMATDHQLMGIFSTNIITDQLFLGSTVNSQTFNFNFKNIFNASLVSDIRITSYLAGISATSQLTNNGFPANLSSFNIQADVRDYQNYFATITRGNGTSLDSIQCTFIYFSPLQMLSTGYQMQRGIVISGSFGGTIQPRQLTYDLPPLPNNPDFFNLTYIFGITQIQSRDSPNIRVLGVDQKTITNNTQSQQIILAIQTQKLAFVIQSSFNFIQIKSLRCQIAGSNCNQTCITSLRPKFIINNICQFCIYNCLTCNSASGCLTCPTTRKLITASNLCQCIVGYYDDYTRLDCLSCFPCATCSRAQVCSTCYTNLNMILNPVTNQCLCQAGLFYITNASLSTPRPCANCSPNCLYCTGIKLCQACDMNQYLSEGVCLQVCSASQIYDSMNDACMQYGGDGGLFDAAGRFGFDWTYTIDQNAFIIDVIFSQTDALYYYYENATGYSFANLDGGGGGGSNGSTSTQFFYYDDGRDFINGYSGTTFVAGGGFGSQGSSAGSGGSSGGSDGGSILDASALRGQYYGLGQAAFFRQLYQNKTYLYYDGFGIPYGKHRLQSAANLSNPNFLDAFGRNIVFDINGQIIPYSVSATSNNRFQLRTLPTKSFLGAVGSVSAKNQALIRSAGKTALQTKTVSKNIDRFDYYSLQQINQAVSLNNNNNLLVAILWGVSKYLLFIGLGWPFMPLMLVLQQIMAHNYINNQIPINLKQFLKSFADFRNPSILYKPTRDKFDSSVVNHPNIYKTIPEYEVFDRGIDFMKNCFQFFFTPLLSFGLMFLLIGLNHFVMNLVFRKNINFISNYLQPRLAHHAAAYTLVQALPVSFFFFAQLNDTAFNSPNQPNKIYPTFNTGMAFASFFTTAMLPILVLSWIYHSYNIQQRIKTFSQFTKEFLGLKDNTPQQLQLSSYNDMLWGGSTQQPISYAFAGSIFAQQILYGFFISFFILIYPWQLAGIIATTALFLGFIIFSSHFYSNVFKYYLMGHSILLLGYQLLHAGVGSNRSLSTYDLINTGYLGIGLIYALLLSACLFSGYLFWKALQSIVKNHFIHHFITDLNDKPIAVEEKRVSRVQSFRNDTHLKSSYLKTQHNIPDDVMVTQRKLISKLQPQQELDMQDFVFIKADNDMYIFQTRPSKAIHRLPKHFIEKDIKQNNNLKIDRNQNVYNRNGDRIFNVHVIRTQEMKKIQSKNNLQILHINQVEQQEQSISKSQSNHNQRIIQPIIPTTNKIQPQRISNNLAQNSLSNNKQFTVQLQPVIQYTINGVKYIKTGQDDQQNFILKNTLTNQISKLPKKSFKNHQININYIQPKTSNKQIIINQINYNKPPSKANIESRKQIYEQNIQYVGDMIELNGEQYQLVQYINPNSVKIRNIYNKQTKIVQLANRQPDEHQENIRIMINSDTGSIKKITQEQQRNMIKNRQLNRPQRIFEFDGRQVEQIGVDRQGRYQYKDILKDQILYLNEDQHFNLMRSRAKSDDPLLLVQSAVGKLGKKNNRETLYVVHRNGGIIKLSTTDHKRQFIIPERTMKMNDVFEVDLEGNLWKNGQIINWKNVQEIGLDTRKQILPNSAPHVDTFQSYEEYEVDENQAVFTFKNYYDIIFLKTEHIKSNYTYNDKNVLYVFKNVRGDRVRSQTSPIFKKYSGITGIMIQTSDPSFKILLTEQML